jgi:hypothetical protein
MPTRRQRVDARGLGDILPEQTLGRTFGEAITVRDATNDALTARFGRIDRGIREVTSRPDALCTLVTLDSCTVTTGLTIPTNHAGITSVIAGARSTVPGARTSCNYNLAVGKYWTQHHATPDDFVTSLSLNGFTTPDDRGPMYSYLRFTPGLRFHLGNDYYLVAGVEVPVIESQNQSLAWGPTFWLMKVR